MRQESQAVIYSTAVCAAHHSKLMKRPLTKTTVIVFIFFFLLHCKIFMCLCLFKRGPQSQICFKIKICMASFFKQHIYGMNGHSTI